MTTRTLALCMTAVTTTTILFARDPLPRVFPGEHWETMTPADAGMDPDKLEEALNVFEANTGADGISEVVIVRHGRVMWRGDRADQVHGVWSCTKSFAGMVTGLLYDDERVKLETRIAEPIGMRTYHWGSVAEENGIPIQNFGGKSAKVVEISADEMARVGWMLLNEGEWEGKQLLSMEWIRMSTRPQAGLETPLWQKEDWYKAIHGAYGYFFWVNGVLPGGERVWPMLPETTFAIQGNKIEAGMKGPCFASTVTSVGGAHFYQPAFVPIRGCAHDRGSGEQVIDRNGYYDTKKLKKVVRESTNTEIKKAKSVIMATEAPASETAPEDQSLFMEERKAEILTLLATRHKVTVAELSKRFSVSTATIRTYLRDLESSGLLVRTHGGAIEKQRSGFEPMAREKENQNPELKQSVAAKALDCVDEGDVILIDTGTTCHAFARRLAASGRRLTVVTNDILIAAELESVDSIQILVLGGLLRRGLHCTVGIQGQTLAEGIVVDKAFMATNAFSLERGATTPDINQAASKQQMAAMAHKVFLLCDHSKIGLASFARFATADEIDVLVCDDGINPTDRKQIESAGIEVL